MFTHRFTSIHWGGDVYLVDSTCPRVCVHESTGKSYHRKADEETWIEFWNTDLIKCEFLNIALENK